MGIATVLSGANWETKPFPDIDAWGICAIAHEGALRKTLSRILRCIFARQGNAVPKWRLSILRDPNPRILRPISKFPDFAIYSADAAAGFRIAALLFKGGQSF